MKSVPRVLLFAISCFFLFSCASTLKSSIKDNGGQIPPDFTNADETLLVIRKGKKSYDKYLEKNFEENYFGKYTIIDREELESNKYQKSEVYRYVFDEDLHQDYLIANDAQIASSRGRRFQTNGQSIDYGLNTYAKFQVLDRRSGIVYKTKHGTGQFSKWMRAYTQALEKSRQEKAHK